MQNVKYFQTIPVEQRQVVVVGENDERLGTMNILEAHKGGGVMHRAISVVLYRQVSILGSAAGATRSRDLSKVEVLLQKRSEKKPLWPLYWSNTVCTHPMDGEGYLECAVRRLKEEMGIVIGEEVVEKLYRFKYQAQFNEELSEFELDTVLVGWYEGEVKPDTDEVTDYKWIGWEDLLEDVEENGGKYTPWFKMILKSGRVEGAIRDK